MLTLSTAKALIVHLLIVSFTAVDGGRQRQQGAPVYLDDVTVTVTHYTTTSSLLVKLTHGICASMVSASEPCIRKREAHHGPIILAYDDELHDELFSYFHGTEIREDPSDIIAVEDLRARAEDAIPLFDVESSIQGRSAAGDEAVPPLLFGRLGFKVKQALGIRETFTETFTLTSTLMSTTLITTSTKSFILENCIPPNFNFPECK